MRADMASGGTGPELGLALPRVFSSLNPFYV